MLGTVLACEEFLGTVKRIESPVGLLDALVADLADRPDLQDMCCEGKDHRLHVHAGGLDWFFGGWG